MTETRERPDPTPVEGAAGYTGLDNGDTAESTGYPTGDMGGIRLADGTGVPIGATGQDTGYADLTEDDGGRTFADQQDTSAPTWDEAREKATRPQSEEAAGGDDTDEDGERVDTSDIGYETPMGEKEPSA
jgi:hypothetical protein